MRRPEMIAIPEGAFRMGAESRFPWESPRHWVCLGPFHIGRRTVTRREYGVFLRVTSHAQPAGWTDPRFQDPDQPVVGVSWFDAGRYCEWLTERLGETFRLPTEAEWEKACRGGRDGAKYAWGNDSPDSFAYFTSPWTGPRPAGGFPENGFGLQDIGHNVHEWCADWYSDTYYQASPERDPRGPETGLRRVSRGGSWRHQVKASRAAHRSSLPPAYRYTDYGFRIVSAEPATST